MASTSIFPRQPPSDTSLLVWQYAPVLKTIFAASVTKKDISILARSGFSYDLSKKVLDIPKEEFKKINNYNQTVEKCHDTVGVAILNTSITIVFGFSILVLSNFIPTIYFGIFTALAMLLAMISVLTLLPSLILITKPFGK